MTKPQEAGTTDSEVFTRGTDGETTEGWMQRNQQKDEYSCGMWTWLCASGI